MNVNTIKGPSYFTMDKDLWGIKKAHIRVQKIKPMGPKKNKAHDVTSLVHAGF